MTERSCSTHDNRRLERIENKLDKLADAMVTLVETRADLANLEVRVTNQSTEIKKHDERLDEIEKKIPLYDDRMRKSDTKEQWIWRFIVGFLLTALLGVIVVQ